MDKNTLNGKIAGQTNQTNQTRQTKVVKGKIFVIDDDTELLATYMDSLVDEFEVLTFDSPLKALNEVRKGNVPNLIVSDFSMPEMNGLQFSEQMKERGYRVPIVLVSGFLDKKLSMEACNAGVFGVIEKPCDQARFDQLIDDALTADGMRQRNQAFKKAAEEFIQLSSDVLTAYKTRYQDAERLLRELGLLAVPMEAQIKRVATISDLETKMVGLVEKLKEIHQVDLSCQFVHRHH